MKITIDNETYDISDELANEIRERARAESGEFVKGCAPFFLDGYGNTICRVFENDHADRLMLERGRVSRSREYLERYDARELARERLRRAYLRVVGDWKQKDGEFIYEPYFLDGEWSATLRVAQPVHPYCFKSIKDAAQFGIDNDADLRTVMEVD
jgi:hypothetical protein